MSTFSVVFVDGSYITNKIYYNGQNGEIYSTDEYTYNTDGSWAISRTYADTTKAGEIIKYTTEQEILFLLFDAK